MLSFSLSDECNVGKYALTKYYSQLPIIRGIGYYGNRGYTFNWIEIIQKIIKKYKIYKKYEYLLLILEYYYLPKINIASYRTYT